MNKQRSRSSFARPKAKQIHKSRRRRRSVQIAQVIRGIVLEGFGALALISLYLMVSGTGPQLSSAMDNPHPLDQPNVQKAADRHVVVHSNQPVPILAIWSTWGGD